MANIFISGAGRGIGLALVQTALARGWNIFAGIRDEKGRAALAALGSDRLKLVTLDVTDSASVANAAQQINEPLDVLVNNAGVIGPDRQSTLDMDFDGFANALAVNTLAPLRVSQAFLPHVQRAKQGRIVTISSKMGMMDYAKSDRIAYRASKSAVNKVMQGLATDLKPQGIAVQLIHPGWVRTDMGGPEADISVEQSAQGIMDRIEALTMETTGTFVDYAGETIPW